MEEKTNPHPREEDGIGGWCFVCATFRREKERKEKNKRIKREFRTRALASDIVLLPLPLLLLLLVAGAWQEKLEILEAFPLERQVIGAFSSTW